MLSFLFYSTQPTFYHIIQNKLLKQAVIILSGHIIKSLNFIGKWEKNIFCDSQIKTPLGLLTGPFKSSLHPALRGGSLAYLRTSVPLCWGRDSWTLIHWITWPGNALPAWIYFEVFLINSVCFSSKMWRPVSNFGNF